MMTRRKRIWIGLGAGAVALFILAWAASPVFAMRGLIAAARVGDARGLERHVDFPAVRADLKSQLTGRLIDHMRQDQEMRDNPWAALGVVLAPTLVEGAVDAFVTPQAISAMVRTAEAPEPTLSGETLPEPEPEDRQDDAVVRYGYRGFDSFAATVSDPDTPDQAIDLVMQRRGLFDWKLVRIGLPEPTADAAATDAVSGRGGANSPGGSPAS